MKKINPAEINKSHAGSRVYLKLGKTTIIGTMWSVRPRVGGGPPVILIENIFDEINLSKDTSIFIDKD